MCLLTFSALARRLDLPESRARKLLKAGVLVPMTRAGRQILFEESRVEAFKQVIERQAAALKHSSQPIAEV
jgi:hypothetical protein